LGILFETYPSLKSAITYPQPDIQKEQIYLVDVMQEVKSIYWFSLSITVWVIFVRHAVIV
jgi:hypothetical protein